MEGESAVDYTEDDDRKVFVSRIPRSYNDEDLQSKFEEVFGPGAVEQANVSFDKELEQGKGFGFVVFKTKVQKIDALKTRTVKADKNFMYVRNVQREGREGRGRDKGGICFLWQVGNCTHGDHCRFKHEGPGSVIVHSGMNAVKKAPKCFKFRKGKCLAGDACPFRHVGKPLDKGENRDQATKEDKDKPCFNWKKKGKCRKGDTCPYSHATNEVGIKKRKAKADQDASKKDKGKRKKGKYSKGSENDEKQTHVRIFGLNYDTTKEQVERVFGKCGKIVGIEFPVFEDSKRSKGFCGIEFENAMGATKCVKMDGHEVDGRWLRIQKGKMFKTWDKDNSINKNVGEKDENDTIFVGNLDFAWDEKTLADIFQKRFGKVVALKLSRGKKKALNGGFCHCQFHSIASAVKAVKSDGSQILGRRVQIDFANAKDDTNET